MKNHSARSKTKFSFIGALLFFLTSAAAVSAAVLVYSAISSVDGIGKGAVAGVMLAVVVFIAAICTLIDFLRRKYFVLRPVERILTATEQITGGNFDVSIEPFHSYGKYDDYDLIIENLNVMAAELSKTEMLSNDFISNVSHEIKTPLSVIQNYAAAIKDERLSDKRGEYADTLIAAAKRLNDLIANILKLNKLENQEIILKKKRIGFGELVRECVLGFESAIDAKNIALECEISDAEIFSDGSLIEIVVNNLLSNAIKFTPPEGAVKVTASASESGVKLTVADTGCGMSAETGAKIFDKFYQGDASRSVEGNGLGLALVKKVIDILGGTITVESKLGKGSAFTVAFDKGAPL